MFLNDGNGFPKSTEYSVGKTPDYVAVADLNRDGKLDMAVANAGSGTICVLLNNTKGGFNKATSYSAGTNPGAIAIEDFNGDGNADLAVANAETGSISILLGTGGGKFGSAHGTPIGDPTESSASSLAVADSTAMASWTWP